MKSLTLTHEQKLWDEGYQFIAGADEVGRGCFAGPVVAACVVFPSTIKPPDSIRIHDSKKLTALQRQKADKWIRHNALTFGVGQASAAKIDKHGLTRATNIAFRCAAKCCLTRPEILLIDAFFVPFVRGINKAHQRPIIRGDGQVFSIAAASILAKVYRDNLMIKLSQNPRYAKYLWHKNKGYGTKDHRNAIKKHGATRLHRVSFLLKTA